MKKKLLQSILISYLIGVPIGLLTVIATIYIPLLLTGEGLLTMVVLIAYKVSIIGLLITFLIALWVGGIVAYQNAKISTPLLLISLKYSTVINLIIWTTFCLIIGVTETKDVFFMMLPAIIAFFVCTILTTFSIGLLISYLIKRLFKKPVELLNTN
ncbi:hypothetical protein [Polaribacter sp.]|uniref:hypothetical protein n=1 Tax=Polaribacter sp. TaxID=1920175 RepID=UPI003F6CD376